MFPPFAPAAHPAGIFFRFRLVLEQVDLPAGRNAQVVPYNDETDAAVEAVGGDRLVVGTVQLGRRHLSGHFRRLGSRWRGR